MALTLLQQLISYLDSLGLNVTQQNVSGLQLGTNGSAVNNTTLKQAAASSTSTSGTSATSSTSTGSGAASSIGGLASAGLGGAQLFTSMQQSKQAEQNTKIQEQQIKAQLASQEKTNQSQQAAQSQATIRNDQATVKGDLNNVNASIGNENLAEQKSQAYEQQAEDYQRQADALPANTPNYDQVHNALEARADAAWDNETKADNSIWGGGDVNPGDSLDAQVDAAKNVLANDRTTLMSDGGTDPTTINPGAAVSGNDSFDGEFDGPDSVLNPSEQTLYDAINHPGSVQTTSDQITDTIPLQPMASLSFKPNTLQWNLSDYMKIGVAIGSGVGLFESIKSLASNFSISGLMGGAFSVVGIWQSLSRMHSLFMNTVFQNGLFNSMPMMQSMMRFLTSGPGIAIIIGVIVLLALLMGIVKNTTPAAVELPVTSAPTVWTSSAAVYFIGAGAVLASAGLMMGPAAPITQTVTVPTSTLTAAFNSAALTDASGNTVGTLSSIVGPVFVDQGSGPGGATQVVYVTPGANGQEVANVETLATNLKVAAPTGPASITIPFFIGNSLNPLAVKAVASTNANMQAAPALANSAGTAAIRMGAASDKSATVH